MLSGNRSPSPGLENDTFNSISYIDKSGFEDIFTGFHNLISNLIVMMEEDPVQVLILSILGLNFACLIFLILLFIAVFFNKVFNIDNSGIIKIFQRILPNRFHSQIDWVINKIFIFFRKLSTINIFLLIIIVFIGTLAAFTYLFIFYYNMDEFMKLHLSKK